MYLRKFRIHDMFLLGTGFFFIYILMRICLKHSDMYLVSTDTLYLTLPYVLVHIDLKGAPLKLDYLQSLIGQLKGFGANGFLMEYEDMFPYDGKLVNISSRNCYNKTELNKFLIAAANSDFQIIPLIPTFGHMEYVLKLTEYQHLCEMPLYCDVICPSKKETTILIHDMLKQVIDFHNNIVPLKHIHIGCNDVYDINTCSSCRHRRLTKTDLYIRHIISIAEIVQNLSPGTKVLFWDDMIRKTIQLKKWANITFKKGLNLEPVYLDFRKSFAVSHFSLHRYRKKFNSIWIASAFKGADGRTATIPNIKDRFQNNLNWMNLILDYKFDDEDQVFTFKGIILTGLSRYSHFDPLCELFPVSMPSVIVNLLMIHRFKQGVLNKKEHAPEFFKIYLKNIADKTFSCSFHLDTPDFEDCLFETKNICSILGQYTIKQQQFIQYFVSDTSLISLREFYTKRFVDKRSLIDEIKYTKRFHAELEHMENVLKDVMSKYYNDDVIREYIHFRFAYMIQTLIETNKTFTMTLESLDYYIMFECHGGPGIIINKKNEELFNTDSTFPMNRRTDKQKLLT